MLQEFRRSSPATVRHCYHGGRRLLPWRIPSVTALLQRASRPTSLELDGGQEPSWLPMATG